MVHSTSMAKTVDGDAKGRKLSASGDAALGARWWLLTLCRSCRAAPLYCEAAISPLERLSPLPGRPEY